MVENLDKTKTLKKLSVKVQHLLEKISTDFVAFKRRINPRLFYTNKNKKDSLDLNYFSSD